MATGRGIARAGWAVSLAATVGVVAWSVAASLPSRGSVHWETDFQAARARAKREGKPILIDFWAPWCGWCRKMDQEVYTDGEVAGLLRRMVAVKINSDDHPEIFRRLGGSGLPYTVFLDANGGRPQALQGYVEAREFRRLLAEQLESLSP